MTCTDIEPYILKMVKNFIQKNHSLVSQCSWIFMPYVSFYQSKNPIYHLYPYLKLEANSVAKDWFLPLILNKLILCNILHLNYHKYKATKQKQSFPTPFNAARCKCWINKFACASRTKRERERERVFEFECIYFHCSSDSVGFRYLASTHRLHITEYMHIDRKWEEKKKTRWRFVFIMLFTVKQKQISGS